MQAGTHLRWAFAPELGFPPGAFWLCRRSLRDPLCGPNAPPVAVSKAMAGQQAKVADTSAGIDNAAATASATTNAPQGLGSVVSFGAADSAPPDRLRPVLLLPGPGCPSESLGPDRHREAEHTR